MPIILECVLRAAGNETHTERESGTQKGRARGQSVRGVGIFRLLTGVCEMQILGVTIVTTISIILDFSYFLKNSEFNKN